VRDTGIGIEPAYHERVFQEFEQLDSSFQRMHEGSGLGLALTRKLVELHGGVIWCESEGAGKGSTFTFALPITPETEKDQNGDAVRIIGPESGGKDKATQQSVVLVVEDDPHARELLTHYLCEAGYRVALARDGEEALTIARELHPAAITLDVLLPKRDGWDVLRELKHSPETSEIPVIIVSIAKDNRLGFSLGAMECLAKPVKRDSLLDAIARTGAEAGESCLSVLVIDDEPACVEVLSGILRAEGHHVFEACCGQEGIDMAIQHLPDVIILDLNMPVVTGFDVLQRLREHPEAKKIPVVVHTAQDLAETDRQWLNTVIHGFVPKSDSDDLLQVIAGFRDRKQH
jgi:CheY-like chemotaxis protein